MTEQSHPIKELLYVGGLSGLFGAAVAWAGNPSSMMASTLIAPMLIWLKKGGPRSIPPAIRGVWDIALWVHVGLWVALSGLFTWAFSRDLPLAFVAVCFVLVSAIAWSWEDRWEEPEP
jgi:hypothetical protein